MVFSSTTFLFYFLPLVLLVYWGSPATLRNPVLLLASLFFYAWGEGVYMLLMLFSIFANYTCGRLIESRRRIHRDKFFLALGVAVNLLLLCYFKYAVFFADNLGVLLQQLSLPLINVEPVRLPIGISFFTFQALSYLVDVYRQEVDAQKNLFELALYIALFPQLIAGPIVRYQTVQRELHARKVQYSDMAEGIERFVFGLSKKVLLANPMALVADQIFSLPQAELTMPLAWLGAVCYTFQIYYDFSGYSDMAIGLGRMFGFHFLENFNYPYISRSIKEFWRRWHISLSTWFRDYVYFPMGGNRRGSMRTSLNLVTIFLLCGLWHGASWTFVAWGLYHGFFLAVKRTSFRGIQNRIWAPVQILLTMLIVMVGWVIFRSESLSSAIAYIKSMFQFSAGGEEYLPLSTYLNTKLQFELLVASVLAVPVYPMLKNIYGSVVSVPVPPYAASVRDSFFAVSRFSFLSAVLYFSVISLAAGVYNPFIYFRF